MKPQGRVALALRCALSAWIASVPGFFPVLAHGTIRVLPSSARTSPVSSPGYLPAGGHGLTVPAADPITGSLRLDASLPGVQTIAVPRTPRDESAQAVFAHAAEAKSSARDNAAPPSKDAHALSEAPAFAHGENTPASSPQEKKRQPSNIEFLKKLSLSRNTPALWFNGASLDENPAPTAAAPGSRVSAARRLLRRSSALNGVKPLKSAEPFSANPEPKIPKATTRRLILDSLTFYYVTLSSLNWYTFARFIERWKGMKGGLEESAGKDTAVKDFRGFFIAHRVMGSTGNYAPMGFRIAANRIVVRDAWTIFKKYFKTDADAEEAFDRFVHRAKKYNPNRRSTQFRKIIFHALRAGAVMTTAELPAFFDSLATQEEADKLSRYQKTGQREVLTTFEKLVNETILEVNKNKKAGHRIVGALLLGSFANHAAGPESDLDVQLLSEDGSPFGIEDVMRRLKGKWKEAGYARHPIGGFQYALPLSKNLLMRIHQEPYMIFSPYARVLKKMGLTPEEETSSPSSVTTIRGALFVALYTQLLKAILAGYETASFLKRHLPF